MKLSSLLDKKLVFLDQNFDEYSKVIDFVSEKISQHSSLSPQTIKEALQKRENLGTTFVGHRLAMPHGYVEKLDEIIILFIRLDREQTFVVDRRPHAIKYVFAIITSKQKAQLYLKVLSSVAQLVTNNAYILDRSKSATDLIQQIDQKEIVVDEHLRARDLISCPQYVKENDAVSKAVDIMKQTNLTFLPVVDDYHILKGVIDIADLFRSMLPEGTVDINSLHIISDMDTLQPFILDPIKHFWENEDRKSISSVMRSTETFTVHEEASYIEIVKLMTKYRHRYLVVVDDEMKVKGLIDTGDVIHKMIRA